MSRMATKKRWKTKMPQKKSDYFEKQQTIILKMEQKRKNEINGMGFA